MLKVQYQKLRLSSKGNLKRIIGNGIPVLSIFALVGISFSAIMWLDSALFDGFAYAETYTATSGDSSVALTISGAGEMEQVSAGRGETTYRSHNVRVKADVVEAYGLTISGPTNLTSPAGGTTITGANNTMGSSMVDNTWGYGWGDVSTSDANLTYRTLSTSGTNILTVNGTNDKPALVNRAVDFTKKLNFAVRFGEEATPGRYYANVTLSLVATPATLTTYSVSYDCNSGSGCPSNLNQSSYDKSYAYTIPSTKPTRSGYTFLGYSTSASATTADTNYAPGKAISLTQAEPSRTLYAVWKEEIVPWNSMTTMQQMTPGACAGASAGAIKTLTDTRDGSSYTVVKAIDGNCWMGQNLRIVNKTVSAADSDMNSGSFIIPASSTSGFSNSDVASVYYSGNSTYGTYYSWYAATAGTGTSSMAGGEASASICPKGWRLPAGGTSDIYRLYNGRTATWAIENGYYGRWLGASSNAAGGVFFPAAGHYKSSTSVDIGTHGDYWSRTNVTEAGAGSLHFSSSSINMGYYSKYRGYTVRCVAYSS